MTQRAGKRRNISSEKASTPDRKEAIADVKSGIDERRESASLTAAISFAERDWRIFPACGIKTTTNSKPICRCGKGAACNAAGKHPAIKDNLNQSTSDEGRLREWFEKWPTANVAIATGGLSGIVVIDIDPDKGGDTTLAKLTRQHSELPVTTMALSGGAGVISTSSIPVSWSAVTPGDWALASTCGATAATSSRPPACT